MNYKSHSLREMLEEWYARISISTPFQFSNQLKFLFKNIEGTPVLFGIIQEATNRFHYGEEVLEKFWKEGFTRNKELAKVDSEEQLGALNYQFLNYVFNKLQAYNLHERPFFQKNQFEETKHQITGNYVNPIITYLYDKLNKSSSVLYLLEKYKKRTEWFTRKELLKAYRGLENSYEQLFEDDLRLFLFDQGIEYPFSTPPSASGRADIVGELETSDPLIIEIKILDKEKGYGKNRIKEGFTQVVKYASDYNKDVGYLVLFNMDSTEVRFKFNESSGFPPSLMLNGKTFFFVVVNCFDRISASKIGTLTVTEITEGELTKPE